VHRRCREQAGRTGALSAGQYRRLRGSAERRDAEQQQQRWWELRKWKQQQWQKHDFDRQQQGISLR